MAMVAVGGSIGTGLLLGSAPPSVLRALPSFSASCLPPSLTGRSLCALGELACAHPAAGSFGVYGDLYLNDWAGFLSRGGYWAAIAVSIGAEMVAATVYMARWFPQVNAIVWILIFSLGLLLVNFRGVGSYGRFEFWFAMIKVVTIAAFIVLGAALLVTGKVAPQYVVNGGFFPRGYLAPLLAMTFADLHIWRDRVCCGHIGRVALARRRCKSGAAHVRNVVFACISAQWRFWLASCRGTMRG